MPLMIRSANIAATATPAVEIVLPEAVEAVGRTVPVGPGVEVEVRVVVRVEVDVVLECVVLDEDGELEVTVNFDAVDELEVIVEAAALFVELEAESVDFVVEAVDFAVDAVLAEVVEGSEEVVELMLIVEVASSPAGVVIPISLAIWLLKLLMSLTRSRRCKAILISSAVCNRRVSIVTRRMLL
jgi:hypothetical protein